MTELLFDREVSLCDDGPLAVDLNGGKKRPSVRVACMRSLSINLNVRAVVRKKSPIWKDVILQSNHISIPSNGWQVIRRSFLELLLDFWAEINPFPNISLVHVSAFHRTCALGENTDEFSGHGFSAVGGALQRTKDVWGVWTRWFNKAMVKQHI